MKYKVKKEFFNLKEGDIIYDGGGIWGTSAEVKLDGLSPYLTDRKVSFRCEQYPDIFEKIELKDDELIKAYRKEIDYRIIKPLREQLNYSNILVSGIESDKFRGYVLSNISLLQEIVNEASKINIER